MEKQSKVDIVFQNTVGSLFSLRAHRFSVRIPPLFGNMATLARPTLVRRERLASHLTGAPRLTCPGHICRHGRPPPAPGVIHESSIRAQSCKNCAKLKKIVFDSWDVREPPSDDHTDQFFVKFLSPREAHPLALMWPQNARNAANAWRPCLNKNDF